MSFIRSAGRRPDSREPRYGVFLRPDPATAWALTQLTFALQQQFGLVSAAAFAPHATLVGNLALDAPVEELVDALTRVFDRTSPIPIVNRGIERTATGMFAGTFRCDIHHDASGSVNAPLRDVAEAVKAAVLPLSRPVEDYLTVPVADYEFRGHLSVVSHELALDPGLGDELEEFIGGLPIELPREFVAEWFTLFELRADWDGPWWEDQSWRHLRSWRVAAR